MFNVNDLLFLDSERNQTVRPYDTIKKSKFYFYAQQGLSNLEKLPSIELNLGQDLENESTTEELLINEKKTLNIIDLSNPEIAKKVWEAAIDNLQKTRRAYFSSLASHHKQ